MFCPECGKPVPDSARFCGSCGARLQPAAPASPEPVDELPPIAELPPPEPSGQPGNAFSGEPAPVVTQAPRAEKRRLFLKGPAAVIAAVVTVVLVAGGAFASYLLLHRTPKQLFFEVQRNYVAGLANEVCAAQKARLDLQRLVAEKPSQSQMVITGSTRGLDEVDDFFAQAAIEFMAQVDPKQNITGFSGGLRFRNKDLISGEFWQTPDVLALYVPELERDYIVLENRNLRQFFHDLGVYDYTGPDQIGVENELQKVLKESEGDLKALGAEYGRLLYDLIDEDEVTLEKKVRYKSPDGMVELDRLTLRLPEARVRALITELAIALRDDQEALDLFSEIIAVAVESGASGLPDAPPELDDWRDPAHIKAQLQDGLDAFADALEEVSFPDGLTWTVYVDGKQLIDQTLDFGFTDEWETPFLVTVHTADWRSKDETRTHSGSISLRPDDSLYAGDEMLVDWRITSTPKGHDKSETEADIYFEFYEAYDLTAGLRLNDKAVTERNVEKGKDRTTHDFTLTLSDYGTDFSLSGTMVVLESNAVTSNRYEQEITITLGVEPTSPWDPAFDVELSIDATTEVLPGGLDLPDFNRGKWLNDMSDEEIADLFMGMERSLERLMMRNLDVFLGF